MNRKAGKPLLGLVLSGGRSTRMGRDKASLVHADGRNLAKRTHDILLEAGCDGVVLSLRHDQELPPGFEGMDHLSIARDPEGGSAGPLAGMISAMRGNPQADWLVLACDLPRLDVATLRHLVDSKHEGEMFLSYRSEFDGLPEPLCALYDAGSLPVLERFDADGFRCPRKVLIRNNCRLLDPVIPRALENANTPEEWENATLP